MNKDELRGKFIHWLFLFRECIIYITTLTFSLLAIFSAATFCFLVPLLIEPALATLQHKFVETSCTTKSGEWLEGKNRCDWSSCREGCTKETFTCWQIKVEYLNDTSGNSSIGKLFPNVYGCGYPPRIVCEKFAEEYGKIGNQFPCYFSMVNPDIVITELDYKEISDTLIYGVSIPCTVFSVSIIYLVMAYLHIYPRNKKEILQKHFEKKSSRTIEEEEVEELSTEELMKKYYIYFLSNYLNSFFLFLQMLPNHFISRLINFQSNLLIKNVSN